MSEWFHRWWSAHIAPGDLDDLFNFCCVHTTRLVAGLAKIIVFTLVFDYLLFHTVEINAATLLNINQWAVHTTWRLALFTKLENWWYAFVAYGLTHHHLHRNWRSNNARYQKAHLALSQTYQRIGSKPWRLSTIEKALQTPPAHETRKSTQLRSTKRFSSLEWFVPATWKSISAKSGSWEDISGVVDIL